MMLAAAALAAAIGATAAPAHYGVALGIEDGAALVRVCAPYAGLDSFGERAAPGRRSPCKAFLQLFFRELVDMERAQTEAYLQGMAYQHEGCIRLPEKLTYPDMAERLVNHARATPALLEAPAPMLALATVIAQFPCPVPPESR